MYNFNTFKEQYELSESLDSQVEFGFTDDTKTPQEIYGVFTIDGIDYGMSLVQSKYERVYILDFYRIVNVKKRKWSFKKPSHVRPGLSTLFMFFKRSTLWTLSNMDGVIIDLPKTKEAQRYVKFMEKLLRAKKLTNFFRTVPVDTTKSKDVKGDAPNYLFMIKKNYKPENVFNSNVFRKHFDFDANPDVEISNAGISSEVLYPVTVPKKREKARLSTKISDRYTFKELPIEPSLGDELDESLESSTALYKANKIAIDNLKDSTTILPIKDVVFTSDFGDKGFKRDYFFGNQTMYFSENILFHLLCDGVDKKIEKEIISNNELAVKQATRDLLKIINENLSQMKIRNILAIANQRQLKSRLGLEYDGTKFADYGLYYSFIGKFESAFFQDKTVTATEALREFKKYDERIKEYGGLLETDEIKMSKKLDIGGELTSSDMERRTHSIQQTSDYSLLVKSFSSTEEIDKDAEILVKNLNISPEMTEWIKNIDDTDRAAINQYTGEFYSDINGGLRNTVEFLDSGKWPLAASKSIYPAGIDLMNLFEKAPFRLGSSLWVIRNTGLPNHTKYDLGDTITDGAFLSTSISPGITQGYDNTVLKIYLPKGTPTIPAWNYSEYKEEWEIILPPYSVLKIVGITEREESSKTFRLFECIYVGNAMKSARKKLKESGIIMEEKDKPPMNMDKGDKKNEGKWSGYASDPKKSAIIKKLLKNKTLKLDK